MRENLQHHRVMSDMKAFQAHIDFSCSRDIMLLPGKGPFYFRGKLMVVTLFHWQVSLYVIFCLWHINVRFYFTCRSFRFSTKSSFIFCSYVQVFWKVKSSSGRILLPKKTPEKFRNALETFYIPPLVTHKIAKNFFWRKKQCNCSLVVVLLIQTTSTAKLHYHSFTSEVVLWAANRSFSLILISLSLPCYKGGRKQSNFREARNQIGKR